MQLSIYNLKGSLIEILMKMCTFFEDCKFQCYSCLYRNIPPILVFLFVAKYEQKLQPVPLIFTTKDASVIRCTTK